ncbi:hypothetical protein [Aeromicrobium sp.]|uniref:hypothetical protein n=1 Tax=Aeromicrobium sp. TaxID=1871063 RepID=UPI003D6BDDDB
MMVVRAVLVMLGVAAGSWGVWLLSDDGFDRLSSTAIWLAGGVVLHDFVLAPIVVGVGVVATRALPSRQRPVAAVAFLVWGTLTIAVANVLLGVGGKPDMDSLLNRPYVSAWLVLTGLILGGAFATAVIRSRPRRVDDA